MKTREDMRCWCLVLLASFLAAVKAEGEFCTWNEYLIYPRIQSVDHYYILVFVFFVAPLRDVNTVNVKNKVQ